MISAPTLQQGNINCPSSFSFNLPTQMLLPMLAHMPMVSR